MSSVRQFAVFFQSYLKSRATGFGKKFESLKNVFVAILVIKRGKYASSFLNTSFLILVFAAIVAGPIIAQYNPFSSDLAQASTGNEATVVSYDPYESSLGTIISAKPRDKEIEYKVLGGDTLSNISKKFDVSVDTIKWANDLKSESIKPNDVLKIPPGTGVVYKVNSGDNIYNIAKKYHVDAQKIVNFPFNDFADLDTFALTPGQTLFVPDGTIEEAKPATTGGFFAGNIKAGARGSSNFIWPTGGLITQYPIWYHMALDIANPSLPPVLASDTGTVVYAGCISTGYGCHVIIDHGNGYQSLYGHLSQILTSPGASVSQGQQIGVMGSTGRSTGPHLHFEIRSGGTQLNPLNFLK
jgi:murein DD-endopeptidase MepM/ murein hydrolase activator NlpD